MTSSAPVSMTSERSPPAPRAPISTARWAVVVVVASMSRTPAVARRHTANQSSADGSIGPYSRDVPDRGSGRDHLLDGLTPDQRRAVTYGAGRLLVVGG